MEKTVEIKQNTPEWLELRKSKIGASDAPIIMGVSPWKTPFQLWEEKLGIREPIKPTAAMQKGIEQESLARYAYEQHTGNRADPLVVFHPEFDWMMASLDGIDKEKKIIVEIKYAGIRDHMIAANGDVPKKYYPQLQHQLAVIGYEVVHYFSFSSEDYHLVEVKRDEKYIKKLIEKEREFVRLLKNFEAPKLTDKDYVQRTDIEWEHACIEWKREHAKLKEAEEREQEKREALIALANNASCQGAGVRVNKIVRKGSVDYRKIPELEGVDLEKYRKSSTESWKIYGS